MSAGSEPPVGTFLDRFVLPADPAAPGQARRRLAADLAGRGVPAEVTETVLLLASELVTNAVLHGHGEPVLEIRTTESTVWVGVRDPDHHPPQARPTDADSLGGRGLHLVDALAEDWGAVPVAGDGKTVWFLLRR
ncbi:ATP-binding protein [Candidatus Frankia alpina]|uniref:ATP-binding protein n=1 Tax=Candidatus Frankia alpina TaxID=2699483 RepID=A0A4S5BWM1_9ACTN|nr:ATP-binding protein [Candidatus Frankia alpina]THJ37367.1 ATP-binding protein [Candidatus Frankia alpina]